MKDWFIPLIYGQELEGLTDREMLVYMVIKAFKEGCHMGNRQLSKRCGMSLSTFIRVKTSLIEKDKIRIIGERTTLGGKVHIIKANHSESLRGIKRPTVNRLGVERDPKRPTVNRLGVERDPKRGSKRSIVDQEIKKREYNK